MDQPNEKELNEAALDGVTGGAAQPLGVFRCTACGWENPIECAPIPKVPTCKKCGGPMKWYEKRDEA